MDQLNTTNINCIRPLNTIHAFHAANTGFNLNFSLQEDINTAKFSTDGYAL